MATRKYMSLERLTEYDALIKQEIAEGDTSVKSYVNDELAKKAPVSHNHNDIYYTETEVDTLISGVNTSINNITSGNTVVKKAEEANHATSADTANEATHASSADTATTAGSATKATQDGNGKVISSTYETKEDASAKLDEAKGYTDTIASGKADSDHNHDSDYDTKGAASGALTEAKAYTDTKVSGMATTTVVDNKISAHNTSTTAHSDIRDLISALTTKVNNFLDVDDTTTDQLSEVLELIENNNGTLESLVSNKVNVSDIVDNLTTASATKVLSANQGVVINALIEALQAEVDGKADEAHGHAIADVSGLQDALDGKANTSHGTHVSFDSTNKPKMDGTAAFGTSTKVARADHVHPTDTSRASQTDLDTHTSDTTAHITSTERTNWNAAKTHADSAHAPSNAQANVIESIKVNGTAQTITSKSVNITVPTKASDIEAAEAVHGHKIADVENLQVTLTNAANAIGANTNSITALTDRTKALEDKVGDGWEEISSQEISALFAQ